MKQMLIETRQKAEELLQEALSIWRQSDQVDFLEGIEKDPVFSLLMLALAYQANEVDSEIDRLKTEVMQDFGRMLIPYELGHATPATALIEAKLQDHVPEMILGENTPFLLDGQHSFLPLLETRALNAQIHSLTRLDGRRWKATLEFKFPVTDLSHFAFAIKDTVFRDLEVFVQGKRLRLIKPWEYSELPMAPYFALDSMTYNRGQVYNLSSLPMDLFARQNVRLFCVDSLDPDECLPAETDRLDLVFEFMGIPEQFAFSKASLVLNPAILVNAQIHEASLSASTPIVRLSGGKDDAEGKDLSSRQFLQLVRPLENQIFGNALLEVRGVAGDRFNQGSLVKLLNSLITKYRSDFYAFQYFKGENTDNAIFQLEGALSRLKEAGNSDVMRNVTGVYLLASKNGPSAKQDFSLTVKYLTTGGAAINASLLNGSPFSSSTGYFAPDISMVGVPVQGSDEIEDEAIMESLMRYQLVTNDRIVTMADIKLFCLKELLVRYGIGENLIKRIRINRGLQQDQMGCGYQIEVAIVLQNHSFVQRNFAEKLPMAEILLQKMIEVRSANIYPVNVHITIEE